MNIFKRFVSEINEKAVDTVSRRDSAVRISEPEFIHSVGKVVWARFSRECVGINNCVTGFYRSTVNGQACVYAAVGNIDRIFFAELQAGVRGGSGA